MENRYILITYPIFRGSVTYYAIWREFFDHKKSNYFTVSKKFWDKSSSDQLTEIDNFCDINENNFIIFVPATLIPQYIPHELLSGIKSINKPIKLILYLQDSVDRMAFQRNTTSEKFIQKYFSLFDNIYSYDFYESNKYGLNFHLLPYAIPREYNKVLFIGRAKGRIRILEKLARFFRSHKINFDFNVLNDPEKKISSDNINFIDYMRYEDVVAKIHSSTCLLSLQSYRTHMATISYHEAIVYNKKLLTNCNFIEALPYYNPLYMKKFRFVEDIDPDFLKYDNLNIRYSYDNQFSVDAFVNKISQNDLQISNKYNDLNSTIYIYYHFSVLGWTGRYTNNEICFFENKRIESLRVECPSPEIVINYSVYQKDNGWIDRSSSSSEDAGETGKSLPIYKVKFSVEPNLIKYDIIYRIFINGLGWTDYCKNGEVCGEKENSENREISGVHCILRSRN